MVRRWMCSMAGVILVASTSVLAQEAGDLEWRTYGSDLASTRYSPADQINADLSLIHI